ncbi:MAG TPA: hypothetical protein VHQ21_06265 [Rhodanobacteraceae bacterium]|nr:hypothetical protein [Rhodanobacteraceae bacterium]
MNSELKATRSQLIRDVLLLQVKLLIGAARDLAVVPVTLAAAFLDLILSKQQAPRFFHQVLRLCERSDRWIDVWSAARDKDEQRGPVDSILASVEEVVRDPKVGAQRARVLKRWAERQVARARKRVGPDAASPPDSARLGEGKLD